MVRTWRTIRVFVSSTFRDMQAERDYLAKVIFPELRERCLKIQVHLVDIDLRWGVTEEEAEQGKVLGVILEEIDRSRPFFIGILGERYGFVPERMLEETQHEHPWLRNYSSCSLTALEILYGVFLKTDMAKRSFFYFRDNRLLNQIDEGDMANFAAENSEAAKKVAAFKQKIRGSGRPVMENYPCRWDNVSHRVVDLELFGQRVLEDLWTAICEEYPEENTKMDPVSFERQMQEIFVEDRSRLYVGRKEQAKKLSQYVNGIDAGLVVITGETGCGKSAFLSNWYREYATENPLSFILAYFVGASNNSTIYLNLLNNICQELKRKFSFQEEIPLDEGKLPALFASFLVKIPHGIPKTILVIDGLDQLSPIGDPRRLSSLLDCISDKVCLVLSAEEGDCLNILRGRNAEEIQLPPLTLSEQHSFIQVFLEDCGRKLDHNQVSALLAHPLTKNPLYLRVTLEELKLFGKFDELSHRINTFSLSIEGLFNQVLERLEDDNGKEIVQEAFALIALSRLGLEETELLDLLRREESEQTPRIFWARLASTSKAYLGLRNNLICFKHKSFQQAIENRYLPTEEKKSAVHLRLANYFEKHMVTEDIASKTAKLIENVQQGTLYLPWGETSFVIDFDTGELFQGAIKLKPGIQNLVFIPVRRMYELPWHLMYAKSWSGLYNFLTDLFTFTIIWASFKNDLEEYWTLVETETSFRATEAYKPILEKPEKYPLQTIWVISDFFSKVGHNSEALHLRHYLSTNLRQVGDQYNLALSLCDEAIILQLLDDLENAMLLLREAEPIFRDCGDKSGLADCISEQALILEHQYKLSLAIDKLSEGMQIYSELGEKEGISRALANQGVLYTKLGKIDEALNMLNKSERICRELSDKNGLSTVLGDQAIALRMLGNLPKAMEKHKEEEQLSHQLGDKENLQRCFQNQAVILTEQGKFEDALALLKQAENICIEINRKEGLSCCLYYQAMVRSKRGDQRVALDLLKRQIVICREIGHKHDIYASLIAQANILDELGELEQAAELLRNAENICREIGDKSTLGDCLEREARIIAKQTSREKEKYKDATVTKLSSKFAESEKIYRELGNPKELAEALLTHSILLAFNVEQPNVALQLADEALEIATNNGLEELINKIRSTMQEIYRFALLKEGRALFIPDFDSESSDTDEEK